MFKKIVNTIKESAIQVLLLKCTLVRTNQLCVNFEMYPVSHSHQNNKLLKFNNKCT